MLSPSLSLCMIVKNEEEFLARCLSSVAEVVDEMIIADTGSTDRTKEIALSFGAKVFDYQWLGDFAVARNFSLDQATGDWIMIMDGDDELASEAKGKIRDLLSAGGEIEGYRFPIISFLGDVPGGPCSIVYHARIFRNKLKYRYTGALHEQLPVDIYNNCPETTYKIYHYGYLAKVVEKQDKTNRNLVLAEQEFAAEPNNLFKKYNLGAELLRAGDFSRGEKLLVEVISGITGWEAYAPSAFQKLTLCYIEQSKPDQALKTARLGWQKSNWDLSLLYLQGVILLSQGKTLEAAKILEECLALGNNVKAIVFQGAGDSLALSCLSSAFIQMGRPWAAIECAVEAYRVNPVYSFALKAVVAYLWQNATRDETKHYLTERCKMPEDAVMEVLNGWPEDQKQTGQLKPLGQKHQISVCLITQNEAENLRKCLGTVSGIADEIIIVDTGSTDETVKVAERYGALTSRIKWQDDFSLVRNEALKLATGKWILMLDADVEISLADCGKIRRLAETGKADAYKFIVLNFLGGSNPAMRDRKIMLFRNRKSFRYSGAVYENILLRKNGKQPVKVDNTDILVKHSGYNRDLPSFSAKRKRNIRILELELGRGVTPYNLYCLASEYMQTGNYKEALVELEQAERESSESESYYPDIIRKKALCLLNIKDYHRAKAVINQGLNKYGAALKDLNSVLGSIYLLEKRYDRAEKALLKAVAIESGSFNYAYELNREQSCVDLARMYLEKGNWGDAIIICLQVLQRTNDFTPATLLLSDILKKHSRQKNVEVFLERYFNLGSDEVLMSLARAFMMVGWPGLSRKLLNRIIPAWADREPNVLKLKLKAYTQMLGKVLSWAGECHPQDISIKQAKSMWADWCEAGKQENSVIEQEEKS